MIAKITSGKSESCPLRSFTLGYNVVAEGPIEIQVRMRYKPSRPRFKEGFACEPTSITFPR
jgi:hypothetical protein